MSNALLEARSHKLEDIEAIKDLMARYARYVDKGCGGKAVEVDKLSEIFTEDIEWEVVGRGGDAARQSFHNYELTYRRTVNG